MTRRFPWPDLLWSLLIGAGFFLLLSATPAIPGGDDGYRHVKFAYRLIRGQGVLSQPWDLAWFWPRPVDGWFGYHLLLSPFTLLLPLIPAAKLFASLVFASLAFVLFRILYELGAMWRGVWVVLALTGSSMALFRSSLTRPMLLSLVLILAALYYTMRGSTLGVTLVSAAHALSYSMFFLVGFAPGVYFLVRRNRASLRMLAGSCLGMALGLAASPFFPEDARFDIAQAVYPLTRGPAHYLTMELRPLNWEWIEPARVAIVAFVVALGIAAWQWRKVKTQERVWLLLAMCAAAVLVSVRVGRMFDLFVPLAVLFAAAVISPWMQTKPRNRGDVGAGAAVLLLLCAFNVSGTWRGVRKAPDPEHFRGVSQFLAANRPGTLVFNTQWEQYQFLYFWNSANTYLIGIDPSFLYYRDRPRYFLWEHISNDEIATCPAVKCTPGNSRDIPSTVAADFGARTILTAHETNPRVEQALRSAHIPEIYHDQWCSLFEVLK